METVMTNEILHDRKEAGHLLGTRLLHYRDSDAIVVGVPRNGVAVASAIADVLSLPMEIMPCNEIYHPANGKKTIGAVNKYDVFLHDFNDIPQDYLWHRIALLKNAIQYEHNKYYGSLDPLTLRYHPVILVDDLLASADVMIACIRGIRKQSPLKLIVAIPIVTAEAARLVGGEADELVFLKMETSLQSSQDYFQELPKIDDEKVKALLAASRQQWLQRQSHRA